MQVNPFLNVSSTANIAGGQDKIQNTKETQSNEPLFKMGEKLTELSYLVKKDDSDEDDKVKSAIISAFLVMQSMLKTLQSNQRAAQLGCCAFVKMITDTTDIAGKEIFHNFDALLNNSNSPTSLTPSVSASEIYSAIDEAICKLEIQTNLSNAALRANDIIEKLKSANLDDSEIRELFENYANGMDTSIGDTQKSDKNKTQKNISKNQDDSEIDSKITEYKNKVQKEKQILQSKTITPHERAQAETKLESYVFLLEMYKDIKKALKPLNKNFFDILNLSELFN